MALDGFSRIHSVDASAVAVSRLSAGLYPGTETACSYELADARAMPQHADASFAGVLDKGTLDALLCGDAADADGAALLSETWRLLQAGAAYVMITSGAGAHVCYCWYRVVIIVVSIIVIMFHNPVATGAAARTAASAAACYSVAAAAAAAVTSAVAATLTATLRHSRPTRAAAGAVPASNAMGECAGV
jgi:hypothetical protein